MAHEFKMDVTKNGTMLNLDGITGGEFKWRNFGGKKSPNNPDGDRKFDLILAEDIARRLHDLGWRVKKSGLFPDNIRHATSNLDADCEDSYFFMTVRVTPDSKQPPKIYRCYEENEDKLWELKPRARNAEHDLACLDGDIIVNAEMDLYGWKSRRDGILTPYLDLGIFTVEKGLNGARFAGKTIISEDD